MTEQHIIRLNRDRACAATARAWLARRFAHELGEAALQDLELVASELVTNAYVHGRGAIEMRVRRMGDRVRVEVVDEGRGAAIGIREHGTQIGGWGLQLVEDLSLSWGAHEGTTHVWAELPLR